MQMKLFFFIVNYEHVFVSLAQDFLLLLLSSLFIVDLNYYILS